MGNERQIKYESKMKANGFRQVAIWMHFTIIEEAKEIIKAMNSEALDKIKKEASSGIIGRSKDS